MPLAAGEFGQGDGTAEQNDGEGWRSSSGGNAKERVRGGHRNLRRWNEHHSRAENIAKYKQKKRNSIKWKEIMAERVAKEVAEEAEYKANPYEDEEDAKKRREKSMFIYKD